MSAFWYNLSHNNSGSFGELPRLEECIYDYIDNNSLFGLYLLLIPLRVQYTYDTNAASRDSRDKNGHTRRKLLHR